MTQNDINEYKQWLYESVLVNKADRSYYLLLDTLYRIPFTYSIPDDQNRALDAMNLRSEFTACEGVGDSTKYNILLSSDPVNVLEVLIGIADRFSYMIYAPNEEDRFIPCFWELISNLGLEDMCDDAFYDIDGRSTNGRARIRKAVSKWMNRTYRRNGVGGIFPLPRSRLDQRERSIWEQMNDYVEENYLTGPEDNE